MHVISASILGLMFGTGILISGMGNPAKVLNFFDITGSFDPSLAFVMGGALAVTAVGYRLVLTRRSPLLAETFHIPTTSRIDGSLLAGAALFGIGWGITGFCPGGVIPMLATGHSEAVVFVASLIVGLIAAKTAKAYAAPGSQTPTLTNPVRGARP